MSDAEARLKLLRSTVISFKEKDGMVRYTDIPEDIQADVRNVLAELSALRDANAHLENERNKLLQDGHDYLKARAERDEAQALAKRNFEYGHARNAELVQMEKELADAHHALEDIFQTLLPVTNTARSTTVSMAKKVVEMYEQVHAELMDYKEHKAIFQFFEGEEYESQNSAKLAREVMAERDALKADKQKLMETIQNVVDERQALIAENLMLKYDLGRAKELQKGAEDAADYAIAMRHRHENLEVVELDAMNNGADKTAELLHKIVLTGRESGVFGGEKVEACAQAILHLRNALKRTKDNFEETERKLYLRIQELEETDLYVKGQQETYAEVIRSVETLHRQATLGNYKVEYIAALDRVLTMMRAHQSNGGPLTTPVD